MRSNRDHKRETNDAALRWQKITIQYKYETKKIEMISQVWCSKAKYIFQCYALSAIHCAFRSSKSVACDFLKEKQNWKLFLWRNKRISSGKWYNFFRLACRHDTSQSENSKWSLAFHSWGASMPFSGFFAFCSTKIIIIFKKTETICETWQTCSSDFPKPKHINALNNEAIKNIWINQYSMQAKCDIKEETAC